MLHTAAEMAFQKETKCLVGFVSDSPSLQLLDPRQIEESRYAITLTRLIATLRPEAGLCEDVIEERRRRYKVQRCD